MYKKKKAVTSDRFSSGINPKYQPIARVFPKANRPPA